MALITYLGSDRLGNPVTLPVWRRHC
jgi:hypothetical protein